MPIYDYKCSRCGRFEKMQKISAEPLTVCPVCGSPVQRLISKNVGIVLKGPGFYKTDSQSAVKDKARKINQERQKDNEALLDGDVSGYVGQSEATDKKIAES